MSKFTVEIGAVDTSLMVAVKDTTGAILETLTAATPGLVCHMAGADEADTSIPLVALASITAAHTDGGFIYRPLQKLYRLDLPDTVSVLGKRTRVVSLYGAALMEPSYSEIEVVSPIETGSDDRVLISADSHAAGPVLADKTGFSLSGTKQTLDDLNDLTAAAVNAEVDAAIADVNLDHIAGTATGIPALPAGTYLDQMMDYGIKKNEPFNDLEFLMVDSIDHATAMIGLTVTGQRSIDGGAFVGVSGAISEVGSGIYQIDLLPADTNGDSITYMFSATGADNSFVMTTTR